jgi:hypothetical protein
MLWSPGDEDDQGIPGVIRCGRTNPLAAKRLARWAGEVVESSGAVAVSEPLHFHSPLIKPDVRISRCVPVAALRNRGFSTPARSASCRGCLINSGGNVQKVQQKGRVMVSSWEQ